MTSATTPTMYIGIGNEFRQDDALGLWLVKQLQAGHRLPQASFHQASGEGLALIELWQGQDHVVIFDAVMKQGSPGRQIHLSAARDTLPADFFKYSSHAFSLAEAVEMSRVLDRLPRHLDVYGIEGEQFGYGQELSPQVMASCQALLAKLQHTPLATPSRQRGPQANP